jgi:hypothetical protein
LFYNNDFRNPRALSHGQSSVNSTDGRHVLVRGGVKLRPRTCLREGAFREPLGKRNADTTPNLLTSQLQYSRPANQTLHISADSGMVERPGLGKRPSANDRGVSPPPSKRKQQSTTTSKAVANFFTPLSKKEPEKMIWRIVKDSLLVGRYAAAAPAAKMGKRKVAAFDFVSSYMQVLHVLE